MAMRYGHEVVSYVRMPDGNRVLFEELTKEKKQDVSEKIAENVGRVLGNYLSAHPEEIEPFSRCEGVRLIPDSPREVHIHAADD